ADLPVALANLEPLRTVAPHHEGHGAFGVAKPAAIIWLALERRVARFVSQQSKKVALLSGGQFAQASQGWCSTSHISSISCAIGKGNRSCHELTLIGARRRRYRDTISAHRQLTCVQL